MVKKQKYLVLTVTATAKFNIANGLDDIQEWRDHIAEYGEILKEDVAVVEEPRE